MNHALERLRELWTRLTPNQKIFFGTVSGAIALLMVLVMVWASEPEYAVLYSKLETADASLIVDRLKADGTPYELSQGGQMVKVPRDRVHEVRIALAGEGLPSSGTGYELMDTSKLGWTDFVQKLQHRRALEGEIARSVQTLTEIMTARVHLVTPEPSLFLDEEKPATASVVVQLRSGARLGGGQIAGIVHLVSSAVEGLRPDHVTILDTEGNLLSRPGGNEDMGVSADQLELVQSKEAELSEKVESLLQAVLGPGKSVTRIAVEMDFEKKERTVESFDADNPVVRSEVLTNSTEQDGTTSETGTTNYDISKTVEHTSVPAGRISRITASVFVDGTYEDGADGERAYVPRSDEEMTKFQNIIRSAIGFDANRGDEVTVENIAFDNSVREEEKRGMAAARRNQMLLSVAGRVASIILIGAVLFLAIRAIRNSPLFNPLPEVEVEEEPDFEGNPLLTQKINESEILRGRIVELAKARPEEVSRLIRTLMKEDMG